MMISRVSPMIPKVANHFGKSAVHNTSHLPIKETTQTVAKTAAMITGSSLVLAAAMPSPLSKEAIFSVTGSL